MYGFGGVLREAAGEFEDCIESICLELTQPSQTKATFCIFFFSVSIWMKNNMNDGTCFCLWITSS